MATSRGLNVAGAVLAGLGTFDKKISDRKEEVEKFTTESNDRHQTELDNLAKIEAIDDDEAVKSLQSTFAKEIKRLHELDIESFDGDRSKYNSGVRKLNAAMDDFLKFQAGYGQDIDAYDSMNDASRNINIRRSTKDTGDRPKYLNMIQNPGKTTYSYSPDGGLIVSNGNLNFQASKFTNAKTNKGFSSVDYITDYTKELDDIIKETSANLDGLETVETITEKTDDGSVVKKYKDPTKAADEFRKILEREDNAKVIAMVNEDNFQKIVDQSGNRVYNPNSDFDETKEAIVNYLVEKKFPGEAKKRRMTAKSTTVDKTTDKSDKKDKNKIPDYSKWIDKNMYQTDDKGDKFLLSTARKEFFKKLIMDNPKYYALGKSAGYEDDPDGLYQKVGNRFVKYEVTEDELKDPKWVNSQLQGRRSDNVTQITAAKFN